jgi:hypothetical protein
MWLTQQLNRAAVENSIENDLRVGKCSDKCSSIDNVIGGDAEGFCHHTRELGQNSVSEQPACRTTLEISLLIPFRGA